MKAWEYRNISFEDRVYSQARREGACLVFHGTRNQDGYGRIAKNGKLVFLHRQLWSEQNGPIPAGHVVMHTCDNPPCIEMSHLKLGTQQENIRDMDRKGRRVNVCGESSNRAELCRHDIPIIRHWLSEGYSMTLIAKRFGVTDGAISAIKHHRSWKHILPDAA